MIRKESEEFFFESFRSMMFLLSTDISGHDLQLRNADAKSAVLFTPAKQLVFPKSIVNPFGGSPLQ
jgi:hypothetical protein